VSRAGYFSGEKESYQLARRAAMWYHSLPVNGLVKNEWAMSQKQL
jgi:hypothetical protein